MHAGKHRYGDASARLAAGMTGRHSLLHSNSTLVIDDLYPFVFFGRECLLDDIKPRFSSDPSVRGDVTGRGAQGRAMLFT